MTWTTPELPDLLLEQTAPEAQSRGLSTQEHVALILEIATAVRRGYANRQHGTEPVDPGTPSGSPGDRFADSLRRVFAESWARAREHNHEESSRFAVYPSDTLPVESVNIAGSQAGGDVDPLTDRKDLVDSIFGKYAHIPYSSEDFVRDKQAEIELEERKWR